jgi:hypothetical protein
MKYKTNLNINIYLGIISILLLFNYSCTQKNPQKAISSNSQTPIIKPEISQTTDTAKHKYEIKSAKIIFTTNFAGAAGEKILYFDDYGRKEREDFYEGGKLIESVLTDGKIIYKIRYKDKTALNLGITQNGTAYRFNWDEIPENQKKEGFAIKTENMNIAGKYCQSYKIDNSGIITVFAGWNGICLYAEQKSESGKAITKAISIDESEIIPPDIFRLPKGIRVR